MKKAKGQADISHAAYKLGCRLASQNKANSTVHKHNAALLKKWL
jgi:hypothetical protein